MSLTHDSSSPSVTAEIPQTGGEFIKTGVMSGLPQYISYSLTKHLKGCLLGWGGFFLVIFC